MKRIFFLIILFTATQHLTFAQVISLKGNWKFQIGDKSIWSEQYFNDTHWESIYAPSAWEDEGFNGYDGFAWYRKAFDGRQLSKNENYYLNLGFIDDCDEVYLNGKRIGFSGHMPPKFKTAYNNERKYAILPDLINYSGSNVIAIRVYDVTLGGGIVNGKLGIYQAPKSRMLVDLQGLWKFYTVRGERQPKPEAEALDIMVPSAWELQGFARYDGQAWYKRTFTVPADFTDKGQDLVLLLGKIDDFDKVYLNGKFIGSTNDGREFGNSQSFSKLRVYSIPEGLIKVEQPNLLEVFVDDMGNTGGIYEGPIGITTRTNYLRYYKSDTNYLWGNQ